MRTLTAFDLLAKSSPASVSTQGRSTDAEQRLKDYLYVQEGVHEALVDAMEKRSSDPRAIVFLCGTSGDGKSELLRRIRSGFEERYRFHVDATHSFRPDGTALDTLGDFFDDPDVRPVVVGINLGMLANFANHDQGGHCELKAEIQRFFKAQSSKVHGRATFINFNDFPKFSAGVAGAVESLFLDELIRRITSCEKGNPVYESLKSDRKQQTRRWKNYRLLGMPEFRKQLINTLAVCHLRDGVFLPNRTILDTIHSLVDGPSYIFDQLFCSSSSEVLRACRGLDPAERRGKETDTFLLCPLSPEAKSFRAELEERSGVSLDDASPIGLLRLFFMLQSDKSIGNDYHKRFRDDFGVDALTRYMATWAAHQAHDREAIRAFCDGTLRPAVLAYANRSHPGVGLGRLYLGERGELHLSAPVHLRVPLTAATSAVTSSGIDHFYATVRPISDGSVIQVRITYRFYELLSKVRSGYRPQPYDKSTVMQLDALVESVMREVAAGDELILTDRSSNGRRGRSYRLRQEGADIEVEELE